VAAATAGAVCALAGVVYTAMPANAQTAAFTKVNSWNSGFQGQFTVTNNTSSPITGWKVEFGLTGGSTITQSWSAVQAGSANSYTFTNMPWNGTLAPGGSTVFGFIANGSGWPTDCRINGVSCDSGAPPPNTGGPNTSSPVPPTTPSTTPPRTTAPPPVNGTPLGINGQLRVCGVNLCNQYNRPIQLRGMSTHGLQWFGKCYNDASLDALANDWKADLLRIAMYVQEGGYETNPDGFTSQVNRLVDMAEARGMYAIIDFHTLSPGDPNYNLDRAKTFFGNVAARNANKKNVIYEIANEPNGVSWASIKNYADQVIPVIRAKDPDAVVIVGTRGWSSLGVSEGSNADEIINNPINAANVMYTFHFYAASHHDNYRAEVQRAAGRLPIFATEWGTVSYTGDGAPDIGSSTAWLDMFDRLKISYANWTYSDAREGSAAFKEGTCNGSTYAGAGVLKETGVFVRSRIMTPDNFPTS
jgi:endoglucanase